MRVIIILAFLAIVVNSFREDTFHEEFHKEEEKEGVQQDSQPVFIKLDAKGKPIPEGQIYSTPKLCIRQDMKVQRNRKGKGNKSSQADGKKQMFIGWWLDFMNEFYWDDGREYQKWLQHLRSDKEGEAEANKLEPTWYMGFSVLLPMILYMLCMTAAGIIAPIVSFVLFRLCYYIWKRISGDVVKRILRRIWTGHEVGKRQQVLMIYMWAKKAPKIRAQLPWFLRKHPNEDVPEELKKLIPESSSPESSSGDDNVDYYYEGYEKENREAIMAQRSKMKEDLNRLDHHHPTTKKKKRKEAPWKKFNSQIQRKRSITGTTTGSKTNLTKNSKGPTTTTIPSKNAVKGTGTAITKGGK